MANPRAEIPIVVLSESNPTYPISGALITIKKRAGAEATVYSDAGTTNNTVVQPLSSDSLGRVTGWLERGSYEVSITVSGKSPFTEYLDIATASDGSIDTAWIADGAVTLAKMAAGASNAAAGTASLRSLGTSSTTAAAGNDSRLTDERTPKAGSVNTEKIVDGAVTAVKVAAGSGLIPTGAILPFGGTAAPTGFLMCYGESKAKSSFEALWNVIGYSYGGSGANFNIPDLRGRAPFGVDKGAGRIVTINGLGQSGGSFYLQAHSHGPGSLSTFNQQFQPQQQIFNNFNNYSFQGSFNAISGWTANTNLVVGSTSSEGLGGGQNMPPYQIFNYIIKT